jgi:hypothetical protein
MPNAQPSFLIRVNPQGNLDSDQASPEAILAALSEAFMFIDFELVEPLPNPYIDTDRSPSSPLGPLPTDEQMQAFEDAFDDV